MRLLACTQCGSTLDWDGTTPVVTCRYCGARFRMSPSAGKPDWEQAAMRGGCVADRPCLDHGMLHGKVFFKCWLPEGWVYSIHIMPLERAGSMATPFVPSIVMGTEDNSIAIRYDSSNAFVDTGVTFCAPQAGGLFGGLLDNLISNINQQQRQGGNGQMGLDGLVHYPTCTFDPRNMVRSRPLISTAEYCDELAQLVNMGELRFLQEQNEGSWCRRVYGGHVGNVPHIILMEAQISVGEPTWPMQQRMWQVDYEMVLVCSEARFQEAFAEYNKVRESMELGQDFLPTQEEMRNLFMIQAQQTQGVIYNAVMQMQADRNASWDRRNAIINDMHNSTMNTMHQMQANAAATNERVARWQSETIREVNTHAGFTGPVEASTRWDHVYQGAPGSAFGTDTFIGIEGDWLEPGVDFVELPRI